MGGAWRRRLRAGLVVLLLGGAGAVGLPAGAGAATATGQVYLVQGLVGMPVSVELDGHEVAASAQPKDHHRTAAGRGWAARGGPARGDPTRDQRPVHRRRGPERRRRGAVRGGCRPSAPHRRLPQRPSRRWGRARPGSSWPTPPSRPADIRVGGSVLFHDVASGESLSLLVPAATYAVDVVASVGGGVILAPVRLPVKAGTLTRVFAVGNPSNGTADAVVQVLPVGVTGAGDLAGAERRRRAGGAGVRGRHALPAPPRSAGDCRRGPAPAADRRGSPRARRWAAAAREMTAAG